MVPLLLAGPAGSGKTHRCLAEIAERLCESPVGPPLILIAPRQATYQLERQILSFEGVEGFTRLRILSFHRLAQFIFDSTSTTPPKLLDEDGRVMVMRALLSRRRNSLRVYRESAQRDGLAQELSALWREACEHRASAATLRVAASKLPNQRLRAKLEDFADLFDDYTAWLKEHSLRDGDELLDIAADAALKGPIPEIGGLWLDGFAQMTPQERRLLTALLPKCESATLAFCLPERPFKPGDPLSMWSVVSRTYCELREDLRTITHAEAGEETLPRRAQNGRFDASPALAHIEQWWGTSKAFEADEATKSVRVVKCANSESEAIFVAREILKFVRGGGRFRDTAVLVRSLETSCDTFRRVFRRYGIPFFLDRREAVGHHPLAELTRGALRTIAFGYKHPDLFAALKSGLIGVDDQSVDWFENMSLARGWSGGDWQRKLSCGPKAPESVIARVERIRKQSLKPIFALEQLVGVEPSGKILAAALRQFWQLLEVEARLDGWAESVEGSMHSVVWSQMTEWLDSVELAFGPERMSLARWIDIVEAGLASLTVGLIPPSLDQVLIGAVDRSRNPDLRAVFLVNINEGFFPQITKERPLLSDEERDVLAESGLHLSASGLWNLGAEQFYGYIACTRARSHLTVTFAESSAEGEPLNPSLFIAQLRRLCPHVIEETFMATNPFAAESAHELNPIVFAAARRNRGLVGVEAELLTWPVLAPAWNRARAGVAEDFSNLSASAVKGLYGNRLRTSVSKLEQFAMCPFRFFVASGLRAQERLKFELDRREEGSFQHEILAEFHRRVEKMGRKWRDISRAEAQTLIADIGKSLKAEFQEGLANATAGNRFRAEARLIALQDFIASYLELMRDCDFDPRHVELGFGGDGPLPAWEVWVDEARAIEFTGRIDRVDVWIDEKSRRCYALVYDYKSSERKLDRTLIKHSIQQQLPAYLAALQKVNHANAFPYEVRAGGGFYVNLRAATKSARSRAEAFAETNEEAPDFRHMGVFDWALVDRLDRRRTRQLFDYSADGPKPLNALKAMESAEFETLLRDTEMNLRTMGGRVFSGEIAMSPYAKGTKRACDTCFYAGICRIDPWTHEFRPL